MPSHLTSIKNPQCTNAIIMVYPRDFGFNAQTAVDNEFQHRPPCSQVNQITLKVRAEFEAMVRLLIDNRIQVSILDNKSANIPLPDAIFPNNWFSTRGDGSLFIYPMKTTNRQAEVQIEPLIELIRENGFRVNRIIDLRQLTPYRPLEGTGSMVFHHPSATVYATLSERCEINALNNFSAQYQYQVNTFNSVTDSGHQIYHTNVMMACGKDFAVIAADSIVNLNERKKILASLEQRVSTIITISQPQMKTSFCGNIIQLADSAGQSQIVMSSNAYQGFTPSQLTVLEQQGNLIICDIPTIEYIGGGSARCMIAENFLPNLTS